MSGSINSASLPGLALATGARLGKYEIVERLGSGGQSIVYKGYDPLLDRHVAIKQVAAELTADEKFAERFREVAKQLARLACEQVVTIYELIEQPAGPPAGSGNLFVVMEFVDGHTLEKTLAAQPGPIDPKAVLQIIWRIAAGLAAIHKAGIIHRDIKPGNIIVSEGLRVKITDFGVAARMGTAASMRLGTTKYMAPEMFGGEVLDARSDIYSLGMVAYELLLGRQRFNQIFQDVVRDPHSEALRWMKWHSSKDQLAKPLTEVNPEIPAALSAIVAKMLAKDPNERFASVEALGREIKASFSPRAPARPAPRPARRRAVLSAGARAAAGPAASSAGAGLTMKAEEGDQLTLAAREGEPQTAAIPRKPMSMTAKLALIGAAAGVLLAGLVVYLVVEKSRQGKAARDASAVYAEAKELYRQAGKDGQDDKKRQHYQAALTKFRETFKQYDQTAYARQAEVMGFLCLAYVACIDNDDKAMDDNARLAEERLTNLERRRGDLAAFVRETKTELSDLGLYQSDSRQFKDCIQKARAAMAEGDLDSAERILLEEASKYARTGERNDQIKTMRRQVAETKKRGEYDAAVKKGDEWSSRQYDQARAFYLKALETLKDVESELEGTPVKELRDAVQKKLDEMDRERKYKAAMDDANNALRLGQALAAVQAMKNAIAIKPNDPEQLGRRIPTLEYNYWIEQGKKELDVGNLQAAEAAFTKAKAVKSASTEADVGLARIKNMRDFESLRAEGDKFYRQKSWAAALQKYEQAAGKAPADKDMQAKMIDCKYQLKMDEARTALSQGKYDDAIRQANLAKQIKPTEGAVVDAFVAGVKVDQEYSTNMATAQQALKDKKYSAALAAAKAAFGKKASPDAEALIKRIRYEEAFGQGMEALGRSDYASALGYFNMAKGFLSTPEVDDRIQKCQEELKKQGG